MEPERITLWQDLLAEVRAALMDPEVRALRDAIHKRLFTPIFTKGDDDGNNRTNG